MTLLYTYLSITYYIIHIYYITYLLYCILYIEYSYKQNTIAYTSMVSLLAKKNILLIIRLHNCTSEKDGTKLPSSTVDDTTNTTTATPAMHCSQYWALVPPAANDVAQEEPLNSTSTSTLATRMVAMRLSDRCVLHCNVLHYVLYDVYCTV